MAINFYTGTGNISLRDEFDRLLLGGDLGVFTGTPFLLKFTRTYPGTTIPIPCDCLDPVTREPDKDTPCSVCQGLGYLYDEKILYGWGFLPNSSSARDDASPIGAMGSIRKEFYFRAKELLGRVDALYEIGLTEAGKIINPIRKIIEYKINFVNYVRLDNSRIEFVKVLCNSTDGSITNTVRR